MPSPVGHSLAGLCGFMVAQNHVVPRRRVWLLIGSIVIANVPDLDFVPGLLMGDLGAFHHQATHSITVAVLVGLLFGGLASRWKLSAVRWGIWAGGLYLSHVVLDLLVNDPAPPFGVQLFWPFSTTYFISSIMPFARFDYIDPAVGILKPLLSLHNVGTILREIILMAPLVGLAWYFGNYYSRGRLQPASDQASAAPRPAGHARHPSHLGH